MLLFVTVRIATCKLFGLLNKYNDIASGHTTEFNIWLPIITLKLSEKWCLYEG